MSYFIMWKKYKACKHVGSKHKNIEMVSVMITL